MTLFAYNWFLSDFVFCEVLKWTCACVSVYIWHNQEAMVDISCLLQDINKIFYAGDDEAKKKRSRTTYFCTCGIAQDTNSD